MTDGQQITDTPRATEPAPLPMNQIDGLTGLEVLERMLDGRLPLPPFGATMDIAPVSVSAGQIVFSRPTGAAFLNPMGTVHGGWIATILDSAMGCAVQSTLKAGQSYTTTSLTLNYVRTLMPGDTEVRCEASAPFLGKADRDQRGPAARSRWSFDRARNRDVLDPRHGTAKPQGRGRIEVVGARTSP